MVIIGLVAGIWFFLWRRKQARQNQKPNQTTPPDAHYYGGAGDGKQELDSTPLTAMPPTSSPRPSTLKPTPPSRSDNVSPVSFHAPPLPMHSELQGHGFPPPPPNQPELQGHNTYPMHPQHPQHAYQPQPAYGQMPSPISPSEAHGQQIYEMHGHQRPQMHEAYGQPVRPQRAELGSMSWQSGPVNNTYHEMDGGWQGH